LLFVFWSICIKKAVYEETAFFKKVKIYGSENQVGLV
jgi:hypothetical protein